MQKYLVLDYETRSELDLKSSGAYEYSVHHTTRILCASFRYSTKEMLRNCETITWSPFLSDKRDNLDLLLRLLKDPTVALVAHNAGFERVITQNTLYSQYATLEFLKEIPISRWVCTAARAAALAIPRNLEDACAVLKLPVQKDMEGRRLILKMCKPRKETLHNKNKWHETEIDLRRLVQYCETDIAAEAELFLSTPPLVSKEKRVWNLDQRINQYGVRIDKELVETTLELIDTEVTALNKETKELTNGKIETVNRRQELLNFIRAESGLPLENLQAATVQDALAGGLFKGKALRLLEIRKAISRSSTAKYAAFKARSVSDGRVRDSLIYHGASTGRWAGAGIQPQNFPRGAIKRTDISCREVLDREVEWLRLRYGDLMSVFSSNVRGCLIPTEGHDFFCADYAAIEARVLFWIADYKAGVEAFFNNRPIYEEMAMEIFNHTDVKEVKPQERQLGKATILGCGYGMGHRKFKETVKAQQNINVTEDEAKKIVDTYRETHRPVPTLWKNLEKAACAAVTAPNKTISLNHTKWTFDGKTLWCELPSGRRLAYIGAHVTKEKSFNGMTREVLKHFGVNSLTKQWCEQTSWGGILTENVVQAIARDFMAEAMLLIDKAGYKIVLSVHDELLAEREIGSGSLGEFEALMSNVPEWGKGCPIKVEGWIGCRYRK